MSSWGPQGSVGIGVDYNGNMAYTLTDQIGRPLSVTLPGDFSPADDVEKPFAKTKEYYLKLEPEYFEQMRGYNCSPDLKRHIVRNLPVEKLDAPDSYRDGIAV
jgi:hypothetical protein